MNDPSFDFKEKVKRMVVKEEYDVRSLYKTSGCAQRVARHSYFEMATQWAIVANCLWLAYDTDVNDAQVLFQAKPQFVIMENLFCAFFLAEWAIRFGAFDVKLNCLKDKWFIFDFGLLSMMVLETWVLSAVLWLTVMAPAKGSNAIGNVYVLRALRLLRLLRTARMVRLLRALPELMLLVRSTLVASRAVLFTVMLLILTMYVFSILFAHLTKADGLEHIGERYFPSLLYGISVLCLEMGPMADQSIVIRELFEADPWLGAIGMVFVVITLLGIIPLLIGILCEVMSAVSEMDKERVMIKSVKEKLNKMYALIDKDGDMKISRDEFVAFLEQDAAKVINDVGVDVIALLDMTDYLFKDSDKLSFEDFLDMVLRFRGSNTATVKDLVDLRLFVMEELERLRSPMPHLS